jgi:ankyrin repeat protein
MLAAMYGHEAAMKVLLQAGADLTVQDQVSECVRQ